MMAERGPFGRRASSGDLTVVWIGAEEDDPELAVGGREGAFNRVERHCAGREQSGEAAQGQRDKAAAGNETMRPAFECVHKIKRVWLCRQGVTLMPLKDKLKSLARPPWILKRAV